MDRTDAALTDALQHSRVGLAESCWAHNLSLFLRHVLVSAIGLGKVTLPESPLEGGDSSPGSPIVGGQRMGLRLRLVPVGLTDRASADITSDSEHI